MNKRVEPMEKRNCEAAKTNPVMTFAAAVFYPLTRGKPKDDFVFKIVLFIVPKTRAGRWLACTQSS